VIPAQGDAVERWTLGITGLAGLAIFSTFFAFTFAIPQWVEDFAAAYLEREVAQQMDSYIDAARPADDGGLLSRAAAAVYERNEAQILSLKTAVKSRARELLAVSLDAVRDPACECRVRLAEAVQKYDVLRLAELLADNTRLTNFIQQKYLGLVAELKREIRIFTATNAVSFLLLLLIAFAKPQATKHLLFPGVLLLASTLFCAWLYLFSQNWLLTIIHGDYTGFAYSAYLGLVFLFFCDIGLNRGRVTTQIANGVGSMAGSAFQLTPC
jgi:hypothetical protein